MTELSPTPTEVIATYTSADGATFEIDHLGIGNPHQWGEFAVYRKDAQSDVQVAEFSTDAALYQAEHRPPLPGIDELIALAQQAVADDVITEA